MREIWKKKMNMNREGRDKIKKIVSVISLIFWCILIFYFSNQQGVVSRNSSSHVIDFLNKILSINLYDFEYSVFIIRKLAHMFLYFVLYLLAFNVSLNYKVKNKYLYSFIFCLLYSASDEVHQLFIIEKIFKFFDIVIDMLGSSIGFFLIKLLSNFKK